MHHSEVTHMLTNLSNHIHHTSHYLYDAVTQLEQACHHFDECQAMCRAIGIEPESKRLFEEMEYLLNFVRAQRLEYAERLLALSGKFAEEMAHTPLPMSPADPDLWQKLTPPATTLDP